MMSMKIDLFGKERNRSGRQIWQWNLS